MPIHPYNGNVTRRYISLIFCLYNVIFSDKSDGKTHCDILLLIIFVKAGVNSLWHNLIILGGIWSYPVAFLGLTDFICFSTWTSETVINSKVSITLKFCDIFYYTWMVAMTFYDRFYRFVIFNIIRLPDRFGYWTKICIKNLTYVFWVGYYYIILMKNYLNRTYM